MNTRTFMSALLFAGGFCALVYQSVWLRELRLLFGASTPATAAVLAVFMGGLGLGGLVLGRRADSSPNPLRLYALLEAGIAASAALSPVLLDAARSLYLSTGGGAAQGYAVATLLRLLLAGMVLGVPVLMMGATLPAAARAVTTTEDPGRRGLALLYGANTLGGVLGALGTTFALFEIYGVRGTLWMTCLLNLLIAALASFRARRPLADGYMLPTSATQTNLGNDAEPRRHHGLSLHLAAFLAGFVFFVAEIVWYRMTAPLLGGSTFTLGLILGVALLGIGAGGALYALAPPRRPSQGLLALTFVLEGVALMVPFAIGDHLAQATFFLREFGAVSFPRLVFSWSIVAAFVVFPAALVSGYQFPLLVALRGRGPSGISYDVASIYAANTLGSILGSLLGGFVLLPALSAPGLWRLCGVALSVAAVFLYLARPMTKLRPTVSSAALGFLVVVNFALVTRDGPSAFWRHQAIGAGRADLHAESVNALEASRQSVKASVLQEHDGRESSVAILGDDGLAFAVNGKIDGNSIADAITTVGLGIIPAALHNDARTAFVIGLGCGQTAGWLGRVPTLERVDVVELEPFMVTFAERCALANLDALQNPKVRLTIGDGREALVVSDGKYDLIVSEPSNPYRAGIASLYSVDFYREAERHLAEGGLFAQWLQAYEVHPNTLSTVVSTMRAVFPEVSLFGLTEGDLLLVGSRAPLTLQADLLRQRLQQVPFTHALARVFRVSGLEGLLSLHLANPAFARRLDRGEAEWNSDDNPRLEFQFARAVGRGDLAIGQEAMVLAARARGEHRPAIVGAVDWERVQAQQERRFGRTGAPVPAAWRPQNPQQAAFLGHFETRDVQKAAALLTELPAPREDDLFDRLRRAEVRIRAGLSEDPPDDEETELLALESAGVAADVAWLRVMAARKQQPPSREVVPLAVRAIRLTREDPWVDSRRIRQAVAYLKQGLTIEEQHQLADALLVAPFGSHLLDESRWRWAREWSTAGLPDRVSPHCAAAFERNVPWERSALLQRALCFELSHLGPEKLLSAQNALDQFLAYESGGGPMDGNSGGSEPDGN